MAKKIKVFKPDIVLEQPKNNYWLGYNYGKTTEKLKIGREVEGTKKKIGSINFLSGITNINIGFKPSIILIDYIYPNDDNGCMGNGIAQLQDNIIIQNCSYFYKTKNTVTVGESEITLIDVNFGNNNANIMYGNNINGIIDSFDNFGFTINTNFSGEFNFLALE